MVIRLYMFHPSTAALGPGNRFAIWTQGCNRRCTGCISPDSRDLESGEEWDTDELAEIITNTAGIEGITISGGEPFLQAEALCNIIELVRNARNLGVIIYTGNNYPELKESDDIYIKKLLEYTDLLIDGTYQEEYNDGKSLRGSSNQQVIPLTKRYCKDLGLYGQEGRSVEIIPRNNGRARMIGIPPKGFVK